MNDVPIPAIAALVEAAEVVTEAASTYLFENESSAEETPLDRAIVACRLAIAHARQDIPTLLAALATAEERADRLRDAGEPVAAYLARQYACPMCGKAGGGHASEQCPSLVLQTVLTEETP